MIVKTKIKSLIEEPITGEWGEEGNGVKVIRTTNFTNEGRLDLSEIVERNIPEQKVIRKKLRLGDIILEKSGGSPNQPVGRVVYFDVNGGETYLCNNFTTVIRAKKEVHSRFLFWFLFNQHLTKNTLRFQNKTTGILNLQLDRYLESLQIPNLAFETQQKIASILDKADELRRKDQQLLTKYDELLQSIFYQMFGDPVKNEKGWNEKLLKDCVYIKGGGTPNTSVDEYYNGNIPWISPKDMKSRFISDSIDKITELAIENSSAKLIDPRSVLLVIRSGILKKSLPIGLNLLPVAINQDMKALQCKEFLNPVFLMFQLELASSQILQTVRGTTADNISSDVIKNTRLIIPSIGKQQEFEKKITATSKLIEIMKKQLIQSEFLFQSLLQKAFKGELVK